MMFLIVRLAAKIRKGSCHRKTDSSLNNGAKPSRLVLHLHSAQFAFPSRKLHYRFGTHESPDKSPVRPRHSSTNPHAGQPARSLLHRLDNASSAIIRRDRFGEKFCMERAFPSSALSGSSSLGSTRTREPTK
jgi:hypothetical protein